MSLHLFIKFSSLQVACSDIFAYFPILFFVVVDLQQMYVFVYSRNHSSVSYSNLYLVSMLPVSPLVNFSSRIFPEITR